MDTYVQALIMGIVQGLTEFLPVSSSGHLILARAFFGWDPGRFGIAFDVACHVGTLLAVVAFFRADVVKLIAAAPGALTGRDGEYERLGRLIIAAAVKEMLDLSEVGMAGLPVTLLAVGLVMSAIVGYITVKYFVRYLASHSLEVFAYYRFVLAAITVLWLATR